MSLKFIKHNKISLKKHPNFSEVWLHDRICENTSLLGLGDLVVLERERKQHTGGRLDVLLSDSENNSRYEVEIMLGATDPSHIIRCIEYWDIERRRYPAYDHTAVIVAEKMTSRFLNVISLFAGSIPLIAIQLDALQVEDNILLNFVTVLDQHMLRADDTVEKEGSEVNRSWWEAEMGVDKLIICDRLLKFANERASSPMELKYLRNSIPIRPIGSNHKFCDFWPKKKFLTIQFSVEEPDKWIDQLKEAGIDIYAPPIGGVRLRLTKDELDKYEELVKKLVHQSVTEFEI